MALYDEYQIHGYVLAVIQQMRSGEQLLLLRRHAPYEKDNGSIDHPLTPQGRRIAHIALESLKALVMTRQLSICNVYHSPRQQTLEMTEGYNSILKVPTDRIWPVEAVAGLDLSSGELQVLNSALSEEESYRYWEFACARNVARLRNLQSTLLNLLISEPTDSKSPQHGVRCTFIETHGEITFIVAELTINRGRHILTYDPREIAQIEIRSPYRLKMGKVTTIIASPSSRRLILVGVNNRLVQPPISRSDFSEIENYRAVW